MSETKIYHIEEIMQMLPHRYPFLLVDRLEGRRHQKRYHERRVFPGAFPGKSGYAGRSAD